MNSGRYGSEIGHRQACGRGHGRDAVPHTPGEEGAGNEGGLRRPGPRGDSGRQRQLITVLSNLSAGSTIRETGLEMKQDPSARAEPRRRAPGALTGSSPR